MGCDIHLYIEYRVSDCWESWGGRLNPGRRDYALFGKLAGVRGDGPPVVAPRGMPSDAGWNASDDWWVFISDTPSDAYVTAAKADDYARSGDSRSSAPFKFDGSGRRLSVRHPDWHTASWLTAKEFGQALDAEPSGVEYEAVRAALMALGDSRVVFWFDN